MKILLIALPVCIASMVTAQSEFTPDNLKEYGIAPWYGEAKLGISMHWSLFSVPAFKTEWYPNAMYYVEGDKPHKKIVSDYHRKTFGDQKEFGYKDFLPMFTAEKFNADYYADLVKKSGAGYFVAPAVHHDGFALWDSEEIEWKSASSPMRCAGSRSSSVSPRTMGGIGAITPSGRNSTIGIPSMKGFTANGAATTIRPVRKTPCDGNASSRS
jgi:hypothetical protein